MPSVTVTVSEEEQMRLEEILIDRDEKAALEFLKQVIRAKIERYLKEHCKPTV